jgi:putative FmdB family regulatory protein
MPIYEYQCEACQARIERIQKFSDPPLATCEACGGALRKLPSSPAFQFKGSGWYITDYAKKTAVEGTTGEATKPAASNGDTASGGTAKGDAGSTSGAAGTDAGSKG